MSLLSTEADSCRYADALSKGKGSPYSITERRVPEVIPVLDSQPAGDVSHKPGGRPQLLSARPVVTLATLKRAASRGAQNLKSISIISNLSTEAEGWRLFSSSVLRRTAGCV